CASRRQPGRGSRTRYSPRWKRRPSRHEDALMTPRPPTWRRYVRFWGANVADDVDAELQFHIDMRVAEYVARGMSVDEARQRVAARLGDVHSAASKCVEIGRTRERQARHATLADSIWSDVRFGLRSFTRTPAWTVVAVVTMAIGIGVSASVLSVVDA